MSDVSIRQIGTSSRIDDILFLDMRHIRRREVAETTRDTYECPFGGRVVVEMEVTPQFFKSDAEFCDEDCSHCCRIVGEGDRGVYVMQHMPCYQADVESGGWARTMGLPLPD